MPRSALLNVMVSAALKAGKLLSRDFDEVQNLQVSRKDPSDSVAQYHLKYQEIIYQELLYARPKYGFYGEGKSCVGQESLTRWIVDPLNGSTNFLHAIPHFCISIALERAQEIIASVIFNPVTDELYTAERGAGAFLNDRRIRVSSRRLLSKSLISCGIPRVTCQQNNRFLAHFNGIIDSIAGVRSFGAIALDLAYIASGRFDGFWEKGFSPWSIAGGLLLVREAGGFATDFLGKAMIVESKSIISGNVHIHKKLLTVMNS